MKIHPRLGRWLCWAGCLLAAPVSAQVVISVKPAAFVANEVVILIENGTPDDLLVEVDFDYRCASGEQGRSSKVRKVQARLSEAIRGVCSSGFVSASVINSRWEFAPTGSTRMYLDDTNSRRAQDQELEDRRDRFRNDDIQAEERQQRERRQKCGIDADGHIVLERIAPKDKYRCYGWFPALKAAADQAYEEKKAREREEAEAGQKRLQEAARLRQIDADHKKINADRKILEAQQRAEVLDLQRQKEAVRQREEATQAAQARAERESQEMNELGQRYRDDPCGAVTARRASPPAVRPIPAGTNAQAKAGIEQYNAQLMAQWRSAIDDSNRLCLARSQPARAAQNRAALEAETSRKNQVQAQARADLDRANAQVRETVRSEQQKSKELMNQNEELLELMKSLK